MTERKRERHGVIESLRERKSFYYFNQWQNLLLLLLLLFIYLIFFLLLATVHIYNITIAPLLELVFCV